MSNKYTRFYHDGEGAPTIALIDKAQLLAENEDYPDFVGTIEEEVKEHGFYDDSDPSSGVVCLYMGGWPQEGD